MIKSYNQQRRADGKLESAAETLADGRCPSCNDQIVLAGVDGQPRYPDLTIEVPAVDRDGRREGNATVRKSVSWYCVCGAHGAP